MATFQDYKNTVSILQLAEYLGYKPVKGKFTKARPVLQDASGDTILIKNPTNASVQVYWNIGNNEHGSVIDFVQNNMSRFGFSGRNDIDTLNQILSHFAQISYDNSNYMSLPLYEQNVFKEIDYVSIVPELKDLHYLTGERKISPETVQAFIPFIRLVENAGYKNIAFPFTIADKDKKIVGYELRNYRFKSFSPGGDKINATWVADFSKNRNEVNNIFFFESAIDAMSFYELKKKIFNFDNSVFVSSGGFPCTEQFRNVIKAYPENVRIFGCHDNDLHGQLFNIMLAVTKENQSVVKIKDGNNTAFIFNEQKFSIANDSVNLSNFVRKSKLNTDVIAKHPGLKDWNEVLQNKGVIQAETKPVFGRKKQ